MIVGFLKVPVRERRGSLSPAHARCRDGRRAGFLIARHLFSIVVRLRVLLAASVLTVLALWLPGAEAQESGAAGFFEALGKWFQPREPTESTSVSQESSTATRSLPRADRAATASVGARGKRIALVIGNDAYERVAKLDKAGNDAVAMTRELKAAGFEVWPHRNLPYRGMVKAVDTFLNGVSGGDEVVVFFAGHGVQLKSGSYLLPVDIEATSEREVELASLGLSYLAEKLSEAKALFTLLIVDACRDNPLRSKSNRSIGRTRGLQPIEPAKGQMIVYSASKGQQALDRLGDDDKDPNGVFTRELIKRMKHPGMRVEDVVREVQDAVEEVASRINHEQRPAIYNEARGSFYFVGPTTAQTQPSANGAVGSSRARTPEEIEDGFWDRIKDDPYSTGFQAYLNQYPKGRYATQAQLALSKLKTEAPRAAAATANVKDSPKPALTTREDETRTWAEAKASGLRANLESYLARYPNGKYVALARIELKGLDEREKAQLAKEQAAKQQEATRAQQEAQRTATERQNVEQRREVSREALTAALRSDDGKTVEAFVRGNPGYPDRLREAARADDAQAQADLATMLHFGWGIPQNDQEALNWARRSAESGNSGGQNVLGHIYLAGRGVAQSDKEAIASYRKAAEQGDARAQTSLGWMYEQGLGVEKDAREASAWYSKARDQGYERAKGFLRRLGYIEFDVPKYGGGR